MEYGDTAQWLFVIMTTLVMMIAIVLGLFMAWLAVTRHRDIPGRIVASIFSLVLILGPIPWFVILAREVLGYF
jgi:ABC-type Fe3+ transport system permease subunit